MTVDELKSQDWPNTAIAAQVQLSGIYFQAAMGYGPVLNVKSLGLRTASAECPFEFLET